MPPTEPTTEAGREWLQRPWLEKEQARKRIITIERQARRKGFQEALEYVRDAVAKEPTLSWPGEIDDILDWGNYDDAHRHGIEIGKHQADIEYNTEAEAWRKTAMEARQAQERQLAELREAAEGLIDAMYSDVAGVRVGARERLRQALATEPQREGEADGLDAAWRECEAALPEGFDLMVGHTFECRFCTGWWATASKRLEEPPYYPEIVSSETDRPRGEHHDATPAAALYALRDALTAKRGEDGR